MPAFKDLTGQTFGRLTVREKIANINGRTAWRCDCICGGVKETTGDGMQSGKTLSCGCLFLEAVTKHGEYLDPVYAIWKQMKYRCSSPNDSKWHRYGGRGIQVCDRWKESYTAFAADMGPRPEGTTLERLNNDGPYSPDNCAWETLTHQNRNTSQNRLVEFGNSTKPLIEWCNLMDINHGVVRGRLNQGWSVKDALTTPQSTNLKRDIPRPHLNSNLEFNGEVMTIKEWSRKTGIGSEVIAMRVGRQWSLEDTLTKPTQLRPSKPTAAPEPTD